MMGEFECGWDSEDRLPNFPANETIVLKTKSFYLVFQDSSLRITKIEHGNNYDFLWAQGTDKAKDMGGFWSIFDLNGRFIDGNVVAK